MEEKNTEKRLDFIREKITNELASNKNGGKLLFRFPPEPNGYLHIGHAKSICLNFGLSQEFEGAGTNLRFDDTNPAKEDQEYVDSIKRDIEWLGFNWEGEPKFTSDYFDQLYDWAVKLIKEGKAYVDDQAADVIASQKGTPTTPGTNSPFRERSVEENLELFEGMKEGKFEEGSRVLRAKIDMANPNMHLRDPFLYRIIKKAHHRTGDKWCIYPMYDWAHGQSDYIEGITNSLCTTEFEVHRPLYDWFLDQLADADKTRPEQTEFSRLNLNYTVMSKRKLLQLVEEGVVNGWDDPRMPTISGLRRRGYTPASIRNFAKTVGITKRDNIIDVSLLEYAIREDLNKTAPRVMAVLDPIKLVIDNYEEGKTEWLEAENNPEDENSGSRQVPFSKELYIEREDFKESANRKFFRLTIGKEVRLKNAYIIKGESCVKDEDGNITEIHCTYDPLSRSGSGTEESKRKVKGTLHWVSAEHAVDAKVNLYDRLFSDEAPDSRKDPETKEVIDFKTFLNPESLQVIEGCKVEPSLKDNKAGDNFQFQRMGYFILDQDSTPENMIFNKTVGLRDSWAKKN
ncbi:glutamine--tRNA ligase/YqeY domain fusion protein [Flammeovirga sp. SJP92]|uniref:glutamine--tRNA ligase/YqeY domain fusion protein n=1 Tax=Flammeovirga sp. SJP92 TaxID=1775430 RepID=UPI000788E4AE|nr:glutamine--tRNA ligase/YqeY domain fusion protein [Flammeovirga sp. SJP92]KXX70283.1 glutamine--tRNA ligase [Flammeovirga sp. SJP92]